jgi:hypothetical protein
MPALQNWIHKLEVGAGRKVLRTVTLVVALLALVFVYDLRAYRNFATEEAMDSAQLARNISEGKGYTTSFIRPFSLFLVQKHNQAKSAAALAGTNADFAKIQTAHPDLANPPVYPIVLAGLMKVLPFDFTVETKKPILDRGWPVHALSTGIFDRVVQRNSSGGGRGADIFFRAEII